MIPAPAIPVNHEVAVASIRGVASLAWPVVVVVLALAFREQIGLLIDRIREIGVGGTRVLAGAMPTQTPSEAVRPGSVPQILSVGPDDPVVKSVEGALREHLKLDSIGTDPEKISTLLIAGAQLSVAWM